MAIYINRDAPESGIASLLALQGTKGDTELVHMTKPEVKTMMNTGLMSMNKETGLPQFADGKNIFAMLLPMIAGMVFPPLLGPSIGAALGTGAVASGAIAGGMGTALAGMMTGDDPADAITKGLLSGGMSYGLGSAFPETFGFDKAQIPSNAHTKGPLHDTIGSNVGQYGGEVSGSEQILSTVDPYSSIQQSSPNATLPQWRNDGPMVSDFRTLQNIEAANAVGAKSLTDPYVYDIPNFPGSGGNFRSRNIFEAGGMEHVGLGNMPQKLPTPLEQVDFNQQINDRIINRPGFALTRDKLYHGDLPTVPNVDKARELGLEYGLPPQKYGTYSADEISNLYSSSGRMPTTADQFSSMEQAFSSPSNVSSTGSYDVTDGGLRHAAGNTPSDSTVNSLSGTSTGDAVGTSFIDKFRNKLPGSMDEAGKRLVDPKSGVFSKQAMATGLGQLGANFLMPEEQEQLTIEQQQQTPYVPNKRDYVYNRKKPSPIDGLTPSQIRELYEKGGLDRRFYEQPSSGKGVFPVAAQSGGGIEDLIEMSETVGISETPFEGMITGDGHGMQDNVMMPILERGGVAAVSPKEYVVPADVMSMIGNGNADSGAEAMDGFISDFRTAKYGRPTQPPQIDGRSALQSLMRT